MRQVLSEGETKSTALVERLATLENVELPSLREELRLQSDKEAAALIAAAEEVVLRQPVLLQLEAPLQIVGDIHGCADEFRELLERYGAAGDTLILAGDLAQVGRRGARARRARPARRALSSSAAHRRDRRVPLPGGALARGGGGGPLPEDVRLAEDAADVVGELLGAPLRDAAVGTECHLAEADARFQ